MTYDPASLETAWDYGTGRRMLQEAIEADGGFSGVYERLLRDDDATEQFLGRYSLLLRAAMDPEAATFNQIIHGPANQEVSEEERTERTIMEWEAKGYSRDQAIAIMVASALVRTAFPDEPIDMAMLPPQGQS